MPQNLIFEQHWLMHSNICGPLQINTHGNCKNFIIFIDDKTKYCFVYLMKHKMETFKKHFIYKDFVEKKINQKMRILGFD